MKKGKPTKPFHTAGIQSGTGDFYGSGKRNPMGKLVDTYVKQPVVKTQGKPPKKLA